MSRRQWMCVLAGFVLFAFPAFSTLGAERGVTETEIRIGQWGPQTGPAALWGAVARGTGMYFHMINEEGGIHGRKIKYFMRDNGYQPPKTKAVVKEMVEDKQVFAFVGGIGTADNMAVMKYLERRKIPWVCPVGGSTAYAFPPNPYRFCFYPLYCEEATILVDYAVKKLGKKRIAFFYLNDDYGKGGLYGAEVALEKYGLKLAAAVSVEPMDTDLSSHCLKLKEAKADCVIMFVLPKHGAIMLLTAAKMGFSAQWMTSSTLSDTEIMHKITKGLWKGVIFTIFADLPDSPNPLMKKYRSAQKKYAASDRWGIFYYAGIVFAEPMVEGLKRCGRDLTAESFVAAMESIRDFRGIGPKITYGPGIRHGSKSSYLGKCEEGGKPVLISGLVESEIDVQEVIRRLKKQ
jgi:branched-chain amino acid transport system substrate-binding protein